MNEQKHTTLFLSAVILYGLIMTMMPYIVQDQFKDRTISNPDFLGGSGFTETSPIYINGLIEGQNWSDCPFVSGAGTELNPFILSQLQIQTNSISYCIYILNTNCYFKIMNCNLTNLLNTNNNVIILYNSSNGHIYNNSISGLGFESINGMAGISIRECFKINVSMNSIQNVCYNINVINSRDCTINSNIAIGYNNTETSSTKGIFLQVSTAIQLLNNNLSGHAYGVYFEASMENNLTDNFCTNNTAGIHLQFFGNNTVSSNYLKNNSYGISTWNSDNNTFYNNTSTENIHGIYIGTSSDGTKVAYNNCTNNKYGIICSGSLYNAFDNNNVSNSHIEGIDVGWSNYCNFSNNIMNDCPDGMILTSSEENQIVNNSGAVLNNGIRVYFSKFNLFSSNYFSHGYDAFYVNGGGNNTFTQNTMLFCSSGWESANTENNTVFNNTIQSNYFGVQITGTSRFNNISGNTILKSTNKGIYLNGANNNSILNNFVSEAVSGIDLINANGTIIKNNRMEINQWGITLSQSSSFNLINSSIISNSTNFGIYINSGENNTLMNNEIKNASGGISFILSNNNSISKNLLKETNIGISISSSNNINIFENSIEGNGTNERGMYIEFSLDCIVRNNNLTKYTKGISLIRSDNNTIWYNNIVDFCEFAIYLEASSLNKFWNNEKILFTNATIISAGQSIQFNCSAFEAGMNFEWNFGDSLINATDQNPIHMFAKSGFYTVKLTIISATNEFSLYSTQIEVKSVTNAPTNLVINYTLGRMQISWIPPVSNNGSAIIGYNIYRGTSSGNEVLLYSIGNTTSFIDSNLTFGQIYFYRVTTRNGIGESARSNGISAKALNLPDAPIDFKIAKESGYFNLTWISSQNESNSPIIGYKIYRGVTKNNLVLIAETGVENSFIDRAVDRSETYYYQIIPISMLGDGVPSEIVMARYDTQSHFIGLYVSLGLFGGFALVILFLFKKNPGFKDKLKAKLTRR